MDARWRIDMLGCLRAVQGDRVLTRFRTRQTGLLLAYLACYPHRAHPRAALIALLWPGRDLTAGRNSLRVALSSLHRQLEPPAPDAAAPLSSGTVLVTEGAAVRLNAAAYLTDVSQFEARLQVASHARCATQRARHLTKAVELYRGELLPGHFEPWVLLERERLAEAYLLALRQLAALLEQSGDLLQALRWARRRVVTNPLHEEAQYELIRLLAAAGDPGAALRQYAEWERLAVEVRAAPDTGTRTLVARIRRRPVRAADP